MNERSVGKAIASMVLGIVSVSLSVVTAIIIFFLYKIGIIVGIASLICGIIAIVLGNQSRPLGRAIAGFVLGIVATSLSSCIMMIAITVSMFL